MCMFIPDLNVRVNLGDMQCCNGCYCCGSQGSSDVNFVKKTGQTQQGVNFKQDAIFVLERKANDLLLRQKRTCEGWCCGKDELYRDTLTKFYDVQVENGGTHGAEIAALFAAWKKVDFIQLHQSRAALTTAHIYTLYEASQATKDIRKHLEEVIKLIDMCKKQVLSAVVVEMPPEVTSKVDAPKGAGSGYSAEVSVSINPSTFRPLPAPRYDARARSATPMPEVKFNNTRDDEKIAGAVALRRIPSDRASNHGATAIDPQEVALAQFRNIAARKGIGLDQQALEKITDKFAGLMSKDHAGPKSLTVLASPKKLTEQLTYDEAVRVLKLANNFFIMKKELAENPLREPAGKPVDLFEILQVLVHSDKPFSENLPISKGPSRTIYVEQPT